MSWKFALLCLAALPLGVSSAVSRRTFVRCEGASVRAEVYVNGLRIGTHTGAFTAFTCVATTALRTTATAIWRRDEAVQR